jgi:hypothetical protein
MWPVGSCRRAFFRAVSAMIEKQGNSAIRAFRLRKKARISAIFAQAAGFACQA